MNYFLWHIFRLILLLLLHFRFHYLFQYHRLYLDYQEFRYHIHFLTHIWNIFYFFYSFFYNYQVHFQFRQPNFLHHHPHFFQHLQTKLMSMNAVKPFKRAPPRTSWVFSYCIAYANESASISIDKKFKFFPMAEVLPEMVFVPRLLPVRPRDCSFRICRA